jgi:PBS lyase HEAT-like repeat
MAGRTRSTFSPAYTAFIASMNITVEEWREGIGFDLAALENVTDSERGLLVNMLTERLEANGDWREIEALGAIGTPDAKEAIRRALNHRSSETRLRAAAQLAKMNEAAHLEDAIIEALRKTRLFGGLSKALDMAEQHPSPRIQETLLDLALNGDEEQRIHCAALALYLGGKAEEAFDWNHRPFFLRFADDDRNARIEAYKELCLRLGITPNVSTGTAADSR